MTKPTLLKLWIKCRNLDFSLAVVAALSVSLLTYISGITGLYFFDTGINYHYGWLIFNGRVPFVDFKTPLGPLCGLLTALGYLLFGVSYISSVYLSCILVFLAFLMMWWLLRSILDKYNSMIYALLLTVGHLPLVGTLYYNHVGFMLINAFTLVQLVRIVSSTKPFSPKDNRLSGMGWCFIALIALNKVHLGVIFGLCGLGLELSWMAEFKALTTRQKNVALAYRLSGPIILLLGLLIYVGFDFNAILDSLTIPNVPTRTFTDFLSSIFINSFYKDFANNINDLPKLGIGFFTLLYFGLIYEMKSRDLLKGNSLRLLTFAGAFLLSNFIQFSSSAEANISVLNLGAFIILFNVVLNNINKSRSNINKERDKSIHIIYGLLSLYLIFFQIDYAMKGLRKSWNEDKHEFADLSNPGVISPPQIYSKMDQGFFRDITISPEKLRAIQLVELISKNSQGKKIYFGPELEMFYASTNHLPQKGWVLWSHPSISVRATDFRKMYSEFNTEGFDIVLLSKKRPYLSPYLGPLNGYEKDIKASSISFIDVYTKKN